MKLPPDPTPDERHDYNERIAICMFDGGLPEAEAKQIAVRQIVEGRGRHEKATTA
ncbi:MAG: hypothetical protein ACXWYM_00410 [Candidatus Binatia bacterium]